MSRDAILLVIGAIISGMVGLIVAFAHDQHRARATRKALGTLLYIELETGGMSKPYYDGPPPSAPYLSITSIEPLLLSGVLHPQREDDLIIHLSRLKDAADTHNETARRFNAFVASESAKMGLQSVTHSPLVRDLWGSLRDYTIFSEQMLHMIDRLAPPVPLLDPALDGDPVSRMLKGFTRRKRLRFWLIQSRLFQYVGKQRARLRDR